MFKSHNFGLAIAMALKVYTSLKKGLKIKDRKFCGLTSTFVEVTGEKQSSPLPLIFQKFKGSVIFKAIIN